MFFFDSRVRGIAVITEKLEEAETRVTHVDSTEHFDLAQEILLGGDIATLAEQFSDDFDV